MIFGILISGSCFLLQLEGDEYLKTGGQSLPEGNQIMWHNYFYFMIITISTIGFGDILVVTVPGRVIVVISLLTLLGVVFPRF